MVDGKRRNRCGEGVKILKNDVTVDNVGPKLEGRNWRAGELKGTFSAKMDRGSIQIIDSLPR